MASTYKVLAQVSPSASTLTTLYTVPGATSTTISSLVICNTNSYAVTFRVSIQIAAAADATKQYIYYDLPLAANDTFVFTGGITLAATDVVKVYANSANVAFTIYGVEIT